MKKYTYTNMHIIRKIISCRLILSWDRQAELKPRMKFGRWRMVKIGHVLVGDLPYFALEYDNFPEKRGGGGRKSSIKDYILVYKI